MTNTQQTEMGQVPGSEQIQEEVQLTELLPVEHSRIKDTPNDKDPATTDGLKVLRSFTQDNNKNLESQDYDLFSKIDKIGSTSTKLRKTKNESCKRPCEDNEDDDEDRSKLVGRGKIRKVRNKDFPKDEVYYFRQEQQANTSGMIGGNGKVSEDNEIEKTPKKNTKPMKKSLNVGKLSLSRKTGKPTVNKEEVEKDLRLNIDVIIQASYLLERENNNVMNKEVNKTKDPVASIEPSDKVVIATQSKTISESSETVTETQDIQDEKKYNCVMCDAKFKGSGGLRNHYKVVHATGPLYKCDDCGKEFPLKERLKLHVRTHTGFKPYKCPECNKCFARGGQLAQHRRTHSHIKPYQCDLCMGTFTCAANLALHMKRHNGQKDHTCSICGKGFIRRDALKKHLECLHKDLKSFLCVICNKTFKGHLPQHMRTHARDRPHSCGTCGQKFAQKSQLTVHQRTHTGQRPFRCLVCWQAFAHSTALKLHTRRHTGERPFRCDECNVGFTQLPHWKKHMKCIHKRSKPYSCKNCNNFFKKKNDLENHEKACHNTESADESSKTDGDSSSRGSPSDPARFRTMNLEKMRLLLAVLLKRISKPDRLNELGFGKRLIDEILQDSLVAAGKEPVKNGELTELETLRKNLEMFLEWTVPKEHWKTFKRMNKTPEEILETLTTS